MNTDKLPPYLRSEISSRLNALDPTVRVVMGMKQLELTGSQLETLMSAAYLIGYGEGCADMNDCAKGEIPELLNWIEKNVLA